MKLFRTSNIETVSCCQEYFGFALPSTLWAKPVQKFELQFSNLVLYVQLVLTLLYCTLHNYRTCFFAYSFCFKLLPFVVNKDV